MDTLLQSVPDAVGGTAGGLLVALIAIAAVFLIARYLLALAWKLVVIAAVVVGVVVSLGMLGLT